jgi:hypothetical protein
MPVPLPALHGSPEQGIQDWPERADEKGAAD